MPNVLIQYNSLTNVAKSILELIKSELNQGQFKKMMKNDEVREFFELYGVGIGE